MQLLKSVGKLFSTYDISIVESHQSAKKSAPGTAYKLAVQSREVRIERDFLDNMPITK
ncbi:MAG: hypothetical protein C0490_02335 [Marivirga sp.]|nr:hypothetical protein [Marivirga sp.]